MNYKETTDQMAKLISAEILAVCKQLKDKPLDRRQVAAITADVLAKSGQDLGGNIEVSVGDSVSATGEISVKPKNLYTLLLMHGYQVPAEILGDREKWETPIGTFIFRNGEPFFLPLRPVERVTVNLSFTDSKVFIEGKQTDTEDLTL